MGHNFGAYSYFERPREPVWEAPYTVDGVEPIPSVDLMANALRPPTPTIRKGFGLYGRAFRERAIR